MRCRGWRRYLALAALILSLQVDDAAAAEAFQCGTDQIQSGLAMAIAQINCKNHVAAINSCCIKHDSCYDAQSGRTTCDGAFCACVREAAGGDPLCMFSTTAFCDVTKTFGQLAYENAGRLAASRRTAAAAAASKRAKDAPPPRDDPVPVAPTTAEPVTASLVQPSRLNPVADLWPREVAWDPAGPTLFGTADFTARNAAMMDDRRFGHDLHDAFVQQQRKQAAATPKPPRSTSSTGPPPSSSAWPPAPPVRKAGGGVESRKAPVLAETGAPSPILPDPVPFQSPPPPEAPQVFFDPFRLPGVADTLFGTAFPTQPTPPSTAPPTSTAAPPNSKAPPTSTARPPTVAAPPTSTATGLDPDAFTDWTPAEIPTKIPDHWEHPAAVSSSRNKQRFLGFKPGDRVEFDAAPPPEEEEEEESDEATEDEKKTTTTTTPRPRKRRNHRRRPSETTTRPTKTDIDFDFQEDSAAVEIDGPVVSFHRDERPDGVAVPVSAVGGVGVLIETKQEREAHERRIGQAHVDLDDATARELKKQLVAVEKLRREREEEREEAARRREANRAVEERREAELFGGKIKGHDGGEIKERDGGEIKGAESSSEEDDDDDVTTTTTTTKKPRKTKKKSTKTKKNGKKRKTRKEKKERKDDDIDATSTTTTSAPSTTTPRDSAEDEEERRVTSSLSSSSTSAHHHRRHHQKAHSSKTTVAVASAKHSKKSHESIDEEENFGAPRDDYYYVEIPYELRSPPPSSEAIEVEVEIETTTKETNTKKPARRTKNKNNKRKTKAHSLPASAEGVTNKSSSRRKSLEETRVKKHQEESGEELNQEEEEKKDGLVRKTTATVTEDEDSASISAEIEIEDADLMRHADHVTTTTQRTTTKHIQAPTTELPSEATTESTWTSTSRRKKSKKKRVLSSSAQANHEEMLLPLPRRHAPQELERSSSLASSEEASYERWIRWQQRFFRQLQRRRQAVLRRAPADQAKGYIRQLENRPPENRPPKVEALHDEVEDEAEAGFRHRQ